MYLSTSSYRSSSSRFRQRQRASTWHSGTNSTSNLYDTTQSKPRAVSEDYSVASSVDYSVDYSVASSVSSLHQQEQFPQQPQRQQQRQSRASRQSTMIVFLETLVRCFTTRRRRRRRGPATRKMKNNNFETVDVNANSGSNASKIGNTIQLQTPKPYIAVPRNETEMYFMLRSKRAMSSTLAPSKPSIGTMATVSMTSSNSASPPRRRHIDQHPYMAKPSTASRASSAPSTTIRPRQIFIEHPDEDEPLLL